MRTRHRGRGRDVVLCRVDCRQPDQQDCLLFKLKEGGGLELLETDYTQRLEAKVFTYLTTCHSIPAFLSNLTLELFERQTFVPMGDDG